MNDKNFDPDKGIIMPEDALDQIARIRQELDDIDASIMEQVVKRQEISADIYKYKAVLGLPVRDSVRDVLKVESVRGHEADENALAQAAVQRALLRTNRHMQFRQSQADDSSWLLGQVLKEAKQTSAKADQQAKVVAVLTTSAGSHSEAAGQLYPDGAIVPARSVDAALNQLKQGVVDLAVFPVNNSAVGCMPDLARLLKRAGMYIVDDITIPHYLRVLVIPGTKLGNIRRVMGTARHLEQAAKLIKKMGWRSEEVAHTGIATRLVSEMRDLSVAALGAVGGGLYNLVMLETEAYKQASVLSRYVAVAREPAYTEKADCLSMIVRLTHQSGALAEVLAIFADGNVNIKQVYSMNVEGKSWEYEVYLEVVARPGDEKLMTILYELDRSDDKDLQFLGWYQSQQVQE